MRRSILLNRPKLPTGAVRVINGRIEIGGVRFFPNGFFYVSWGHTRAKMINVLELIAAGGFNTIHASANNLADFTAFLDRAAQLGVKVIEEGLTNDQRSTLKDHPALLGHNIADDARSNFTPEEVRILHLATVAADPNHITTLSDYGGYDVVGPYIGTTDVFQLYYYPIEFAGDVADIDNTASTVYPYAPIIFGVPQTFAWGDGPVGEPDLGTRPPTPLEYRCMLYQWIADRAMGIVRFDIGDHHQLTTIDVLFPSLWAEVVQSGAEVTQLSPVLLNGGFTRRNRTNDILCSFWTYLGVTYVVAINTVNANRNASFQIPGNGALASLFPGRPTGMIYSGGNLSGTIRPYEVHIYTIGA